MGRNFPSATELVSQVNTELERFGEMLPLQDRIILKRWSELALNNRAALANSASLQPLEFMLLLILLEEHENMERINHKLRVEIERLKADLL
jgi:hypothetical protein